MLILDTDHMSELDRGSPVGKRLMERLSAGVVPTGTTIVTIEELMKGHLAEIARIKDPDRLIRIYGRAQQAVAGFQKWLILPWDASAVTLFKRLRDARLGIGTMDLRIASIVIATNATLLSRNLRDFARVPELKVEDWLS